MWGRFHNDSSSHILVEYLMFAEPRSSQTPWLNHPSPGLAVSSLFKNSLFLIDSSVFHIQRFKSLLNPVITKSKLQASWQWGYHQINEINYPGRPTQGFQVIWPKLCECNGFQVPNFFLTKWKGVGIFRCIWVWWVQTCHLIFDRTTPSPYFSLILFNKYQK